jgi:hypothetical protein
MSCATCDGMLVCRGTPLTAEIELVMSDGVASYEDKRVMARIRRILCILHIFASDTRIF